MANDDKTIIQIILTRPANTIIEVAQTTAADLGYLIDISILLTTEDISDIFTFVEDRIRGKNEKQL